MNAEIVQPVGKSDRFKKLLGIETKTKIVRLGDKVGQLLPSFATNLPTFDFGVIGTGGIPKHRIIELFGPESSGKTTFALHIIGQEQQRGGIAAFVDAEHALDPTYAAKLGVNVDELLVAQPDSGEEALETVKALVESGLVDIIVVDSVAALVPQAELDGEMGDAHMGLQARLMSQAMRKLTGVVARSNASVIFINQIREKIGVMFGSPETTTGGRALKFYASVRLDIRRREVIKEADKVVGHELRIKAVKNKVGSPFRETTISLYYDKGLDKESDLIQHCINTGVIERAGAWYKFQGKNYRKADLLEAKAEIIKAMEKK